jgi:hypothetical protein
MLNKKEIEALKSKLPRGYFKQIHEKTKLSKGTITLFFNGKTYNPLIHDAALSLVQAENENLIRLKQKHLELIDNAAISSL